MIQRSTDGVNQVLSFGLRRIASLGIDFKNQEICFTNSRVTTGTLARSGVLAAQSQHG